MEEKEFDWYGEEDRVKIPKYPQCFMIDMSSYEGWDVIRQMNMAGWGNGYVKLPVSHKYHGKHYDSIDEFVDVHGGLTFSMLDYDGQWIIGFDTAHAFDSIEKWPKEKVQEETINLYNQLFENY